MHYIVAHPAHLPFWRVIGNLEWLKRRLGPTPLTHESFWNFVRDKTFAAVHFWASWNGHSIRVRKRLHKIFNSPFLAFYRYGALVRTSTGVLSPEVITQYLKNLVDETS
jgi:hypothetical protein